MAMKIDKSRFTPDELATWDKLVAKGMVDPEAADREMEDDKPDTPAPKKTTGEDDAPMDTKKSAPEVNPDLQNALARLATMEESMQKQLDMRELEEVAKKYAPCGLKEKDLVETLYSLRKSGQANYDAYIAALEKNLAMITKSGLFTEIGKSARGTSGSSAEDKAEAKARDIMKADPNISYADAIAKAWEDPALMAEYDAEYNG